MDRNDNKVQNLKFALYYPEIPRREEAASEEIRSSHVETRIKWNVGIGELEKQRWGNVPVKAAVVRRSESLRSLLADSRDER